MFSKLNSQPILNEGACVIPINGKLYWWLPSEGSGDKCQNRLNIKFINSMPGAIDISNFTQN